MHPLNLTVIATGSDEELSSNIRGALARNLPEFVPGIVNHDGTLVVCGSGPSLPEHFNEIKEQRDVYKRPVLACNGAHDFLCSQGFPPDLFLSVDPRDTVVGNVSLKNQDTIYLLASRCHPKLFDFLSDCKIILWHSWAGDGDAQKGENAAFLGHPAIGGGSTSGLRAIQVGYVMGFRRFILYGLDSCLADDRITKRFSGEKAGRVIDVIVDGRTFWCNEAMAKQAEEFQKLYYILHDANFISRGDGLITAIIEARRKAGMRV